MAANVLIGGIPTSATIGALTIEDIEDFSITESATNFANLSGDKTYPIFGGVVNRKFTGQVSFYDADDSASNTLRAGASLAAFTGVFAAKTAGASSLTYALASSCVARVNSFSSSDSGGRKLFSVSVDIFSNNGTAYPIAIS